MANQLVQYSTVVMFHQPAMECSTSTSPGLIALARVRWASVAPEGLGTVCGGLKEPVDAQCSYNYVTLYCMHIYIAYYNYNQIG